MDCKIPQKWEFYSQKDKWFLYQPTHYLTLCGLTWSDTAASLCSLFCNELVKVTQLWELVVKDGALLLLSGCWGSYRILYIQRGLGFHVNKESGTNSQNSKKRTWNFSTESRWCSWKWRKKMHRRGCQWKTLSVLVFSLSPLVLRYLQQLRKDQSTPNRPMDHSVLWSQY